MKKLLDVADRLLHLLVDLDIRIKIIGLAVGSVILLGTVTTLYMYSTVSRDFHKELAFESGNITQDLVEDITAPLLAGDVSSVKQLLNDTLRNNPTVRYAFILDAQGKVLFHTFGNTFPDGLAAANNITTGNQTQVKITESDNGSIWDVASPIPGWQAYIARIGVSDEQQKALLRATLREQLLVTGGVALVGLAVAFLLGSYISAQIKVMAQAALVVTGGDIGHQAKIYSHDDLGRLAQAFNNMSTDLARMRDKLEQREAIRRQLLVKLITAQEEERLRVARELHDNLGGSLASLGYGLQAVSLALDAGQASVKSLLHNLYEENVSVQNDLRVTIYALRPSLLDDLGLVPALRSYVEHCVTSKGIEVEFTIEGEQRRLPSEIETALFRITQEALNNTLSHARAYKVQMDAKFGDEGVDLTIKDDGCGFDASETKAKPEGQAFGLIGMQERAELLDGQLEVVSKPGQGCCVRVHIPTTKV
ncbi:MAG: histidine kinase [Dehalococcoidales bacterium]|nr:histidine kinase [Dehalococcoidales bacterium]